MTVNDESKNRLIIRKWWPAKTIFCLDFSRGEKLIKEREMRKMFVENILAKVISQNDKAVVTTSDQASITF